MRLFRGLGRSIRALFYPFLHLMFACVPGCGQMSQGYMKRGISQTIITCALIFVAVFLEMGVLAVLVVPLWLYSFFDSYNLRRLCREGNPPEDDYMFGLSDVDSNRLAQLLSRRHSLIGWVLVALGLYNLYQIFARRLLGMLVNLFPWLDWVYSLLVWDAPRILGTVLIFSLGLWFIRGPQVIPDDEPPYDPPRTKKNASPVPPKMDPTPWTEAEAKFHEEPEPQAPDLPETPAEEEAAPVVLTWTSEFDVERFEKEAEQEDRHEEQ